VRDFTVRIEKVPDWRRHTRDLRRGHCSIVGISLAVATLSSKLWHAHRTVIKETIVSSGS